MTPAVHDLRENWEPAPGYLNAASMGVPPTSVTLALEQHLRDWRRGACRADAFDEDVSRSRAAFAQLVGTTADQVAVGAQVSSLVATIATSLPVGARVVVPEGEFASVVYPFLVQRDRGVVVDQVPRDRLLEAIVPGVSWVAFAIAQAADGLLLRTEAIREAARRAGARTLADLTQAVGWLQVRADHFDATVTAAYKWLCAPRGSAFLTMARDLIDSIRPINAGWYAGEDVWRSLSGPSMNLAADARRFDVSPAWPAWVGTAPAVELFASSDATHLREYGASLADQVRDEIGEPRANRPVLSLSDVDGRLRSRLNDVGCTVSGGAGRVRISFHMWNDANDVDKVTSVLKETRLSPHLNGHHVV